jgi:hypothetical protein
MSGRFVGNAFVALVACAAVGLGLVALKSTPEMAVPEVAKSAPADERTYYEDQFMTALGGHVRSVSRAIALGMGHRACIAFTEGTSAADIRGVLVQKGLAPEEASRVVLAAVSTFCPDHKDKAMG